jgi:parallel beta-helix repeat protein
MRAANAVRPGDTVLIRGGTYKASSTWTADGTESGQITISNYRGEAVVIDGDRYRIPGGENDVLLQIYGDWYAVSNLELRFSSGYGAAVHGDHCTVENLYAHDNWGSGIYMTGSNGLIASCRASNNSLLNERLRPHKGTWGFGISACRYPQHTTIRGCTAWDNWGEGISTFESHYSTIEDCISYNNQCNFYISDTQYCLFQRNLAYCTPGNEKQRYVVQANISLGDEKHVPPSSNNTVINNTAVGAERNFVAGGCELINALVANNSFVNAVDVGGIESTNVYFHAGRATGARFLNNVILQEDGVAISHLEAMGIAFGHNNWSKKPVSGCRGSGDIVADPRLLKTGPTGPGSLTREWFKLSPSSPARGHAEPVDRVTEDAAKQPRKRTPDIGALEAPAPPRTTRSR